MPPFLKTGLVLVLVYVGYCGLLFLMQRQMIFPRHLSGGPAAAAGPDVAVVWLDTTDGLVEAWFLPVQAEGPLQAGPL
ncbi:MAG TPA: hypothetical protein VK852_08820, partial [Desulfobacterales bacterium]|nr:hypothetical protein [Desulfobacterales bacterium]